MTDSQDCKAGAGPFSLVMDVRRPIGGAKVAAHGHARCSVGMLHPSIEPGRPLAAAGADGVFHVAAFVEKPSPDAAERLIRRGALWNSFVMVFRLDTMISLLRQRRSFDYEAVRQLDGAAYESLAPWNFSRDFLADIPEALGVLQVGDVGWSDWGTPEAVERTLLGLNLVPPWHAHARTAGAACAG